MIHKIDNITSIGKFRNYRATGQVNFHKLTTIFGDNGGGKTTLTSIFRSLTDNNPDIIRSRVSTNHTSPQTVQIIIRNNQYQDTFHTFNSTTGWPSTVSDIEIFDIHFINENVYSGFDFNDEHKKHLHQFVVGAQGVAIQQQIEQNKTAKTLSRQTQSGIEQQLIQLVGNNLTDDLISSFLTIAAEEAYDITRKITDAEAAVEVANVNAVIQLLPLVDQITQIPINIDFDILLNDLESTSETIQDLALKEIFERHCQDLATNINSPEHWLKSGYEYLSNKQESLATDSHQSLTCPFCKQNVDDSLDILKAYSLQFNEEFNLLLSRIQDHLSSLEAINMEVILQSLSNSNQINTERINSWSAHLPNNVQPPVFNIIANGDEFKAHYDSLLRIVRRKIQNPAELVAATPMTLFNTTQQEVKNNIINYNQRVIEYNTSITEFRARIQSIAQAENEANRLRRIQKRFEPTISDLCNQLLTERHTLRTLENAYTQLSQQQQTTAEAFFTSYRDRINHYLDSVFHTPFRIDEVVHVPPQGRAIHSKISYKLTIYNQDISFEVNHPYCIRECLSEGDKSTIALAFFLSKMDIDPNIQNKILIFDDPLSSFDTNRRTYTISVIKALFARIEQLIVLSHNEFFLHELSKDFGHTQKKSLRITENFVARASVIELCDLDKLVQNDYFKHIEALENFRINPNHDIKDTVLGWLRNVLESHLRFKFYKEIRNMTGHQTFGRLITFLDTQGVVFRDNGHRNTIISKLELINSVSWMPHHGIPMPNYTTIGINPNTITAAELDNLIQDTLNLIENQI